jgi:flavodoxin
LEIKPIKECKKRGIKKLFFGGIQVVMRKTPELKSYKLDLEQYDCLILGSPTWAGNFTPPLRTFMKDNKIENKKIALFTSHRGGYGKIFEHWKKELLGNEFIKTFEWNSKKDFSKRELNEFCNTINTII